MGLQDLNGLFLAAGDLGLAPAARATAVAVLDQQVAATDLALTLARGLWASCGSMVLRHVQFQFLSVGVGRRFPARFFGGGVEVVGEVLGVGVANLPASRKSRVSLR